MSGKLWVYTEALNGFLLFDLALDMPDDDDDVDDDDDDDDDEDDDDDDDNDDDDDDDDDVDDNNNEDDDDDDDDDDDSLYHRRLMYSMMPSESAFTDRPISIKKVITCFFCLATEERGSTRTLIWIHRTSWG